jgi:predicted RND superfamily exporter protein
LIRLFEWVIRRKRPVIIFFSLAAVICGFLMLGVGQNYDMSKYLPEDSYSKKGIEILESEYSYNGTAVLMLEGKSIVEVLKIKEQINDIEGVKRVVWLDDIADIKQPIELINEDVKAEYISDNSALLHIIFSGSDYTQSTRDAIDGIRELLGDEAALSGNAIDAKIMVSSVSGNIMTGVIIALAIVLVILLVTTNSFIEVVLFLLTIGVAILLNMGTNLIFGEISYMTFACAAILQLAVSMDYSIFLLHRYELERQTEGDPAKAMAKAARSSFSSILSSGTTTIVGFVALVFMSYTIGADMGLVLAKGIIFSLLCVTLLLPPLTVVFTKAIDKTKHRRLLPNMKKVQHLLDAKAKYVVIALLIIVSVICFMAQDNNTFLYSMNNVGDEKQNAINEKIQAEFGESNEYVVLVPNGNEAAEYGMVKDLEDISYVRNVQGLYSYINPAVPDAIVPESIKDEFISENYSRYIVDVNAGVETQKAFDAVTEIRRIASEWFDVSYVTGASPVIFDMRNATAGDFTLVTWLSILFVGVILLATFRSVTLPVILMFIIEASIWINMSFPYFSGEPMIFIGYMVISSVQLGATIDYAILMTSYYLEGRKTLDKKEASEYAAEKAGMSIVMSSLVLSSAGFVVAATFNQQAMSQLGSLIGRGALLSGFLTIFVLPQVLILLDKVIQKTSFAKLFRRRTDKNA